MTKHQKMESCIMKSILLWYSKTKNYISIKIVPSHLPFITPPDSEKKHDAFEQVITLCH